jgi:hypothetical protein
MLLGRRLLGRIGLVTGLALAMVLRAIITGLLYGVSTTDPTTAIAVVILLDGISVLDCYLPAYRATRINPVAAIRDLAPIIAILVRVTPGLSANRKLPGTGSVTSELPVNRPKVGFKPGPARVKLR